MQAFLTKTAIYLNITNLHLNVFKKSWFNIRLPRVRWIFKRQSCKPTRKGTQTKPEWLRLARQRHLFLGKQLPESFAICERPEKTPWKSNSPIHKPAVIGAVIDLGFCLDLLDSEFLELLKVSYDILKQNQELIGAKIPKNKPIHEEGDLLLRNLDCAVIETLHQINKFNNLQSFDSVRGVFFEGKDLYPNAGFKAKNHIQIAVRNPNCIKGFFIPRELDPNHPKP